MCNKIMDKKIFDRSRRNIELQNKFAKLKLVNAVLNSLILVAASFFAYFCCDILFSLITTKYTFFVSNWLLSGLLAFASIGIFATIAYIVFFGFTTLKKTACKMWAIVNRQQLETYFIVLASNGLLADEDIHFVKKTLKSTTKLLQEHPVPSAIIVHEQVLAMLTPPNNH